MNKIGIHIFVQSPDVCLSVREVRIMHFVALKNDTPDNFEIAFAYLDTRDDIKHYGLFLSSEISERERKKYLKLITDYANAKTIDGKRQMNRANLVSVRFGDAGLLAIKNYNSVMNGRTYCNDWKSYEHNLLINGF